MKWIYKTLFLLLLTAGSGESYLMASSPGCYTLSATRDVKTNDNSIAISYKISVPEITGTKETDNCEFSIQGFGMEIDAGKPYLPKRTDYVEIPPGCAYRVSVENSDSIVLSCSIKATQPLIKDSDVSLSPEVEMGQYEGYLPDMVIESLSPQLYRDRSLVPVTVCPLRYSQETKSLVIYTQVGYKVDFEPQTHTRLISDSENVRHSVDETFENFVISVNDEENAIMKASSIGDKPSLRRAPDYLVLTTSGYESLLKTKFKPWKEKMGFNLHIVAADDWTPETIKSMVKSYYSRYPGLDYLLLFGNNKDLPAYSRYHNCYRKQYVTDYPYACMDGEDDLLADIYLGRIPVDNEAEAQTVIDNIINYEKNPPSDEDFYNTGVHVIDTSSVDVNKIRLFTGAATAISEYLSSNFDKTILDGKSPEGGFYVLYRGHGYIEGWGDPSFRISDIISLNNSNNLPFVFNLTCFSGQFGGVGSSAPYNITDCFAKELLTYSNGGCIVNYSSTAVGLTKLNEGLSKGIFNAIWPSPGIYMSSEDSFGNFYNGNHSRVRWAVYRAGQILEQAKKTLSQYFFEDNYENPWSHASETIHCFGDPTVMLYTEKPTQLMPVYSLSGSTSGFGNDITCVYRASLSGDIYLSNGSSSGATGYTLIAATAHNRIPYIPNLITPINDIPSYEVSVSFANSETLTINIDSKNSDTSISEVFVYDVVGNKKTVPCSPITNGIVINLGILTKGIYIVVISTTDGQITTKPITK